MPVEPINQSQMDNFVNLNIEVKKNFNYDSALTNDKDEYLSHLKLIRKRSVQFDKPIAIVYSCQGARSVYLMKAIEAKFSVREIEYLFYETETL